MKIQTGMLLSSLLVLSSLALTDDVYAGSDKGKSASRSTHSSKSKGSDNEDGHSYASLSSGYGKGKGGKEGKDHDDDDNDDEHDDDHHDDDDDNDWHANKVYICHLTSSATNPSVLIHVSSSAAQAHYDHGDPLEYTNLGYGKCSAAVTPPPPPPPAPTIEVCATQNFDGSPAWWRMQYEPVSGTFTGYEIDGGEPVSGVFSPPGDLFVAGGKDMTFVASGITGESTVPSFIFGDILDDTLGAGFEVSFTGPLQGTGFIGVVQNCEVYIDEI